MLGHALRGSSGREHLVVELKAPSVKVGQAEVGQIKSYAEAVVSDPQFADARVKWDFWVISTEMDNVVRRDATAPHEGPVLGRPLTARGQLLRPPMTAPVRVMGKHGKPTSTKSVAKPTTYTDDGRTRSDTVTETVTD
ncbi:histidine kinase [Mycobacterium tuberculosis]|nr:histidine kinase [Mycobacterium tuberculosis]